MIQVKSQMEYIITPQQGNRLVYLSANQTVYILLNNGGSRNKIWGGPKLTSIGLIFFIPES